MRPLRCRVSLCCRLAALLALALVLFPAAPALLVRPPSRLVEERDELFLGEGMKTPPRPNIVTAVAQP